MENMDLWDAFGAEDCSGSAMKRALGKWFALYYGESGEGLDGCLQVPYTIVRKLSRAVFSEYEAAGLAKTLPHTQALELALIGGECYLKPTAGGWHALDRRSVLVFDRDAGGEPTDVGLWERTRVGRQYFTLLERRRVEESGMLTVTNRLFRSTNAASIGKEVSLKSHGAYAPLPARYTFPQSIGSVGLVRLKCPGTNCIDGSREGVSVYAPAAQLLDAIAENEAQLRGEFRRGQSRLVVSRDLLDAGQLKDDVFVALDESPDTVGITVFAPALREQSYLSRQQAYLRAVENIIGLKRGLLSQVEAVDRTATEITSSEGEYMCTIRELQKAWAQAVEVAAELMRRLTGEVQAWDIKFGDGVL